MKGAGNQYPLQLLCGAQVFAYSPGSQPRAQNVQHESLRPSSRFEQLLPRLTDSASLFSSFVEKVRSTLKVYRVREYHDR
ncbi:hypothetical protein KEM48_004706 [Puccinia striiformis f. sp. tritici PST-130]|nr:hypothetical protein KEM48_004706 [Puccinia striiformis f. sp. tritici PST-130]